jgi:hypothetical protein
MVTLEVSEEEESEIMSALYFWLESGIQPVIDDLECGPRSKGDQEYYEKQLRQREVVTALCKRLE